MFGLGKKYNYESLADAIKIVVPHDDEKEFCVKTIKDSISDGGSAFESSKYRFGYMDSERKNLNPSHKQLPFFVFYDLITESYLQLTRKINSQDDLWSRISILLINHNLNQFKSQLDSEIYYNHEIEYHVDNSNMIFNSTEFVIYKMSIENDSAIGLLPVNSYNQLIKLLDKTPIELKIMNG
ncbi:hypothetical protein BUL40_02320 [Croceivirga radicis]|uniref:Uncharacterized protein n=1 Tax=Croceivirga radicis TaxID=1929488 RepID=A0A1V6LW50_9FLAO|nr:hypothetical protein [Croceivirga radicis]OQD44410.1 hypothetical protein BUL40_02320 [Croceivirga radicis]